MIKFKVICSQKLDDGDTALIEEYKSDNLTEVEIIVRQYAERSIERHYVKNFTVNVEINR